MDFSCQKFPNEINIPMIVNKLLQQQQNDKAKKLEKTSIVEALRSKKQKNCNISQFPQFLYMITINEALKLLGL